MGTSDLQPLGQKHGPQPGLAVGRLASEAGLGGSLVWSALTPERECQI